MAFPPATFHATNFGNPNATSARAQKKGPTASSRPFSLVPPEATPRCEKVAPPAPRGTNLSPRKSRQENFKFIFLNSPRRSKSDKLRDVSGIGELFRLCRRGPWFVWRLISLWVGREKGDTQASCASGSGPLNCDGNEIFTAMAKLAEFIFGFCWKQEAGFGTFFFYYINGVKNCYFWWISTKVQCLANTNFIIIKYKLCKAHNQI